VGPSHQTARALVQLVVGDVIEAVGRSRSVGVHGRSVHPEISGPHEPRCGVFSTKTSFEATLATNARSQAANGSARGCSQRSSQNEGRFRPNPVNTIRT